MWSQVWKMYLSLLLFSPITCPGTSVLSLPPIPFTHVDVLPVTLLAVSAQVQLTEDETEYCVVAIKHIYDSAIVFQFTCTNTVAEQVLERVTVAMDLTDAVRLLHPEYSAPPHPNRSICRS